MDSIADMGPKDAVFLDNFFPRTTDVQLRLGCIPQSNIPAGREIRTLIGYKGVAGNTKLFAAANDGVYDVTPGGSIVSAAISATLGVWQFLNTTTPGGSFLLMVNGQDNAMLYNGTSFVKHSPTGTPQTISSITRVGTVATVTTAAPHGLVSNTQVTVSGATPAQYNGTFLIAVINATQFSYNMANDPGASASPVGAYTIPFSLTGSNISPTSVINVSLFKSRVIFCVKDSMSFFYLPVNQVAGAASEFPLSAVFRKGGYLMATESWTLDGGNGPDDYFVAATSEGEVAIYKGTDPSNASSFALVGVFELAQPMARKCLIKAESDTFFLTKQAIYPLGRSLGKDDLDKTVPLTRKIEKAWNDATAAGSDLFGWQAAMFPEAGMMLVNVPILNYPTRNIIYSYQYVMNLTTRAWCRFVNWNAEAILAFDGKLYYALHEKVFQAWTGGSDNSSAIQGSAKTAFNALSTSRPKHIEMVRPIITAAASITLQLGIDMDFADNSLYSSSVSYQQSLSLWDSAVWNQSVWNGNSNVLKSWRTIACNVGRFASVRLRITSKDVSMTWIATDVLAADSSEVMG